MTGAAPARGLARSDAPWLGAGVLLTFSSSFGQTFFIAVFAGEIRAEFALGHGAWGAIYGLGTLAAAVAMLWLGGLADRLRTRTLGMGVLLGLAAACLAMAATPGVVALAVVIFALRLGGQGMASHVAITAVSRWFVATRGRALAITTLGFSVGEATLPLLFAALLTLYDWRILWVAAACLPLAAMPALRACLRTERVPAGRDGATQIPGRNGRHWTRAEVLRDRVFWLIVPALIGPPTFITAFFFHQVHLADSRGWAHVQLVALFPAYTALGLAAAFAFGWALDRLGATRLLPLMVAPLVLGFLALGAITALWGAAMALALTALTMGAQMTLPGAFWAERYGTRHLGAIRAMAATAMVFGSAVGPAATGALIDRGLPLTSQAPAIAIVLAVSAGLAWAGCRIALADAPA